MRILLVSAYHPGPHAVSSGPKLVGREIETLRNAGHAVTVVSFENELDRSAFPAGLADPQAPGRVFRITPAARVAAALRHPMLPFGASARPFIAGRWVRQLLDDQPFDDIRVEFIQALEVVPRRLWGRVTLVAHDVLTQLWERRHALAGGPGRLAVAAELMRVRRWEADAFRRVGRLVTLNDKDRDLARRLSAGRAVDVRYPQTVRYVEPGERARHGVEPRTLLYWGHMARRENVDAVLHFACGIFPRILAAVPDARLIVAGIDPPEAVRALAGPRIEVTGYLADPAPVFRRAAVGVVPLRLGAGIKIKTIEMLDCGMPVVATSVGAEGVRPSPLLTVADDEDRFADAVVNLIGPC